MNDNAAFTLAAIHCTPLWTKLNAYLRVGIFETFLSGFGLSLHLIKEKKRVTLQNKYCKFLASSNVKEG